MEKYNHKVQQLVIKWEEKRSVDFKLKDYSLAEKGAKLEFTKDIVAMANTCSLYDISEAFIIIGIDNPASNTSQFNERFPFLKKEKHEIIEFNGRINNIITARTIPKVDCRYEETYVLIEGEEPKPVGFYVIQQPYEFPVYLINPEKYCTAIYLRYGGREPKNSLAEPNEIRSLYLKSFRNERVSLPIVREILKFSDPRDRLPIALKLLFDENHELRLHGIHFLRNQVIHNPVLRKAVAGIIQFDENTQVVKDGFEKLAQTHDFQLTDIFLQGIYRWQHEVWLAEFIIIYLSNLLENDPVYRSDVMEDIAYDTQLDEELRDIAATFVIDHDHANIDQLSKED